MHQNLKDNEMESMTITTTYCGRGAFLSAEDCDNLGLGRVVPISVNVFQMLCYFAAKSANRNKQIVVHSCEYIQRQISLLDYAPEMFGLWSIGPAAQCPNMFDGNPIHAFPFFINCHFSAVVVDTRFPQAVFYHIDLFGGHGHDSNLLVSNVKSFLHQATQHLGIQDELNSGVIRRISPPTDVEETCIYDCGAYVALMLKQFLTADEFETPDLMCYHPRSAIALKQQMLDDFVNNSNFTKYTTLLEQCFSLKRTEASIAASDYYGDGTAGNVIELLD